VCQTVSPFFHLQQILSPPCKPCSDVDRDHHAYSSNTIASTFTYKPAIFSLACCLAKSQQAVLRDQFSPSEKLAETRLQKAVFPPTIQGELVCLPETDTALPRSGKGRDRRFPFKITEHSIPCTTKASVRQFETSLDDK